MYTNKLVKFIQLDINPICCIYVLQSPHGQFVVCHNFICCLKDSSVGAFFASVGIIDQILFAR